MINKYIEKIYINNMSDIKIYSKDDDIDFMGFVEADNLISVKEYIAKNFSKSHVYFIEDFQYHECYYKGLISEIRY